MTVGYFVIGDRMELLQEDLVILYLYERRSYDLAGEDEVPHVITRESVSTKCGILKADFDGVLKGMKNLVKTQKKSVIGRIGKSDCLFLSSKGVQKARELLTSLMEMRVDYVDDNGKLENKRMSEVKEEMDNFNIELDYFDLYLMARRDGSIGIREFIEPDSFREKIFSDHAYPEMVFLSNTSCIPFGGIFHTFGEPAIILPINKKVEIGVHLYGKGNVIRWMKRRDNQIEDAYYVVGKRGFESLATGHSTMLKKYKNYESRGVFKDEEEFKSYFDVLGKFDYSIVFSGGTGHGISLAGHVGTILAALAIKIKDGVEFPFNGKGENALHPRITNDNKVPVWDFQPPSESRTITEMINERHEDKEERDGITLLMKKFVTLSQIFESHWNSYFSKDKMDFIEKFKTIFNLREFSSGGACIASSLASPTLIHLEDDGSISFDTKIYPEMARNQNIGLMIDRKGSIDNPGDEFRETIDRFSPIINIHGNEALAYFKHLKSTSGALSKLAAHVILDNQVFADPESVEERKAIGSIIMLQRGIYKSLGIENHPFDKIYKKFLDFSIDIEVGPVGVGNSGTYFFSVPDSQSMHTMKNGIEKINLDRAPGERLEHVTHGSSHSYIFNVDPLSVLLK